MLGASLARSSRISPTPDHRDEPPVAGGCPVDDPGGAARERAGRFFVDDHVDHVESLIAP
jgi:hypothetical protein